MRITTKTKTRLCCSLAISNQEMGEPNMRQKWTGWSFIMCILTGPMPITNLEECCRYAPSRHKQPLHPPELSTEWDSRNLGCSVSEGAGHKIAQIRPVQVLLLYVASAPKRFSHCRMRYTASRAEQSTMFLSYKEGAHSDAFRKRLFPEARSIRGLPMSIRRLLSPQALATDG